MELAQIVGAFGTQIPVLAALIWFLIYFTKRVDAKDASRESWFIENMDKKDALFAESIKEIMEKHSGIAERICNRIDRINDTLKECPCEYVGPERRKQGPRGGKSSPGKSGVLVPAEKEEVTN